MLQSFYEDTSVPLLASPEADKWPGDGGDVILPEFMNYSQDCLVPELFLLENIDDLPEKYDEVEPEEELLSILEEIITEDEKKTEGKNKNSRARRGTRVVQAYIIIFSACNLQVCISTKNIFKWLHILINLEKVWFNHKSFPMV